MEPPGLPPLTFATSHLESLDEYQDTIRIYVLRRRQFEAAITCPTLLGVLAVATRRMRAGKARRVQIDESLKHLAKHEDAVFCPCGTEFQS